MRWQPGGRSEDIEDRRDESGGSGGGPGGFRLGLGGALVLLVLSVVFRKNFFAMLDVGPGPASPARSTRQAPQRPPAPQEEKRVQFVSFVLDDVQGTWARLFESSGKRYPHAKLVLFRNGISSACGFAQSATGPFYCPGDHKVYIDLGFYDELKDRFGAPGDFAQAYVIAHEVGHHIQSLLGVDERVRAEQRRRPDLANALSVRMELQADCLAGVWGNSTEKRNILEKGDVEAGLNAAAAIGDDRLQRQATGHVSPESFTHGSSRQRVEWFKKGLTTGTVGACDTFAARSL